MPKYDVTDEAVINAGREVVYQAVVNELEGKTSWCMPHLSSKLLTESSSFNVEAVIDLIWIHSNAG
ncbi:MAG: hypothetical protein JW882_13430 [Deltaproteobacteria bacterium]|nr:hypothetical protein [Deltaproteobacteria bacterium]